MPQIIEGKIIAKGMKFGIVASRFNDFICGRLIDGAVDALIRAGADDKEIQIHKVPGAFELPLAYVPSCDERHARAVRSGMSGQCRSR